MRAGRAQLITILTLALITWKMPETHAFAPQRPVSCASIFALLGSKLSVHVGTPYGKPVFATLANGQRVEITRPGDEIFELGQGRGGGTVYLVRPRGEKDSYVLKVYDSEFYDPATNAQNDFYGLAIVDSILRKMPGQRHVIRTIRAEERIGADTVRLEYVPGRDLGQIWSTADPADRQRLFSEFNSQLAALRTQLEATPQITAHGQHFRLEASSVNLEIDTRLSGSSLPVLRFKYVNLDPKGTPKEVFHLLKADNVLLTREGALVIIDPR